MTDFCLDVPTDLNRSWTNLGEMYVGLRARRDSDAGPGLPPPSTYSDSQTISYMVGPSGAPRRSVDISIFNDINARTCFYRFAGYDEAGINARVTALRNEHPDDQAAADAAVATYIATLPQLQQQIYRVVGMIAIFQQDYRREGGVNVGGGNRPNPDSPEAANPNIITDYEIQQYAAEALEGGDENPEYNATGGRILSGIHSVIGMMTYLTTRPPVVEVPRVVTGDGSGGAPVVVPPAPPPDTGYHVPMWVTHYVLPGLAAVGLGSFATWLIMRNRGNTPPPQNNPPNRDGRSDGRAEARVDVRVVTDAPGGDNPTGGSTPGATRVVTDSPAIAAPRAGATRVVTSAPPVVTPTPAVPVATRTVAAADGDMADLAAALATSSKDKSPAGGVSPSGLPTGTGITADNVIIRGADARPSAEINRSVVMAEIAYLNPRFLTEDGTAIHSNYRAGVEQLADLAMAAFGDRGADAPNPGELWRIEHGARGSMIRGGLPEAWLRTFVNGQLERWHEAGAPGMSFDAVAREAMERDAARRAGERSSYERWVEDALRDPARLAGR